MTLLNWLIVVFFSGKDTSSIKTMIGTGRYNAKVSVYPYFCLCNHFQRLPGRSHPYETITSYFNSILSQQQCREFHLEHYNMCPQPDSYPIRFPKLNISVVKNKVRASGEVLFTDKLFKKDGIVMFQFRQCPTDATCDRVKSFELKGICQYLTANSMFAGPVGENFTPKIKCPVANGTYKFDVTIFLQKLVRFPFAKFRTKGKMMVADIAHGKKSVVCMEAIIELKN